MYYVYLINLKRLVCFHMDIMLVKNSNPLLYICHRIHVIGYNVIGCYSVSLTNKPLQSTVLWHASQYQLVIMSVLCYNKISKRFGQCQNNLYIIDLLAAMELFDVWKVISVATNLMWLMRIQDI